MPYAQQSIAASELNTNWLPHAERKQAVICLHSPQQIVTAISSPEAADRQELEHFVRAVFKRAYDADIYSFMPQLMSLRDLKGGLLAVCGLRHANQGQLFLETYLDAPIESVLTEHIGETIQREEILEVGNLAVAEPATARSLLASVSVYLHSTNSQWAVFTGIPALRNSLTKLNMRLEKLGEAKITSLPGPERAAWGSYYAENPQVMAIRRMHQ